MPEKVFDKQSIYLKHESSVTLQMSLSINLMHACWIKVLIYFFNHLCKVERETAHLAHSSLLSTVRCIFLNCSHCYFCCVIPNPSVKGSFHTLSAPHNSSPLQVYHSIIQFSPENFHINHDSWILTEKQCKKNIVIFINSIAIRLSESYVNKYRTDGVERTAGLKTSLGRERKEHNNLWEKALNERAGWGTRDNESLDRLL